MNLKEIVNRCIEKYDWFVYKRAYNTMKRMCERNGGFAYLLELHIKKYRELHPISKELELSTETFYNSLEEECVKGIKEKV